MGAKKKGLEPDASAALVSRFPMISKRYTSFFISDDNIIGSIKSFGRRKTNVNLDAWVGLHVDYLPIQVYWFDSVVSRPVVISDITRRCVSTNIMETHRWHVTVAKIPMNLIARLIPFAYMSVTIIIYELYA